jgi:hypothetical protein
LEENSFDESVKDYITGRKKNEGISVFVGCLERKQDDG